MATDRSKKAKTARDRVEDFLGAVVPLRAREIPEPSTASDLSNVVPITSRKRIGPDKKIPKLAVAADGRPAPLTWRLDRRRTLALLVIGSCVVHASLFAAFNRPPPPLASVGEIAISAELVLGTDRAAGRERAPSESEISSAASPKKDDPIAERAEAPQKAVEEKTPDAAPAPKETVTAAVAPDPVAELPMPPKEPVEQAIKPPVEEKAKPVEKKSEPVPAKKRAQDSDAGKSNRKRAAPSSTPSVASNSIGRGHSDASTNYRGLVSAHLARYKQFPADARSRGDQGTASVSFSLDGGGRVTSVRLARGSGVASIDQETQAMVRRASPFPAPPDGRGQSFTVPVQFNLR